MTTATHAAWLGVVIQNAKIKNGLTELGKERIETGAVQRRLENVDDVFHY